MPIDPLVLSSITAAVTVLSENFAKGLAGEAGKATWSNIKSLFGWHTDPPIAEIPEKVAGGLEASPDVTEKLLELLKSEPTGAASSLVQNLTVIGGKVVIAGNVQNMTVN